MYELLIKEINCLKESAAIIYHTIAKEESHDMRKVLFETHESIMEVVLLYDQRRMKERR